MEAKYKLLQEFDTDYIKGVILGVRESGTDMFQEKCFEYLIPCRERPYHEEGYDVEWVKEEYLEEYIIN